MSHRDGQGEISRRDGAIHLARRPEPLRGWYKCEASNGSLSRNGSWPRRKPQNVGGSRCLSAIFRINY